MPHRICWESSDHTSETINIRADMLAAIVRESSDFRRLKEDFMECEFGWAWETLLNPKQHNRHAKQEIRELKLRNAKTGKIPLGADT